MKIIIKSKKDGVRIRFRLPLVFMKTRLFLKIISSDKEKDEKYNNKERKAELKKAYKGVKKYIKENGHFNLVEVKSADGDIVLIRV